MSEIIPVKLWAYCLAHGMPTINFGNLFIAFDITLYYLPLSFSVQDGNVNNMPRGLFLWHVVHIK